VRLFRLLPVLVLVASAIPASIAAETSGRPDIVFLLTDDMRADDWRVLTQTQALAQGTLFDNFVYTTPLCCPTRVTLQRGQYAHNTGIHVNSGKPFKGLDSDTIASALDAVGYHTIYVGKYLNAYVGRAPG
jgi:N-acetylglucosamine-6-sulfatase